MHDTTKLARRHARLAGQLISADPRDRPEEIAERLAAQWTTWTGSSSIIRLPRSYSVGLSARAGDLALGRVWLERTNA